MTDRIRTSFLLAQERDAAQLAADSDVFSIEPLGPAPHERFILRFDVRGMVASPGGPREFAGTFGVGAWFPEDYLYRAAISQVLTWLGPDHVWHPNVRNPFICLGTLRPGTPLTEIAFRTHAVITYQNFGLAPPVMNAAAGEWTRRNIDRFPIDPRPLKRRIASFNTQVIERGRTA